LRLLPPASSCSTCSNSDSPSCKHQQQQQQCSSHDSIALC
jgi:hypothetical protein